MLPDSEKALSALKAGDVATACALFDQAIDTETDPPCLLQAALCYRSANRLNDALSVLKKLDDMGQTNPPALLLRAEIFCAVDRHHQALPLYRKLSEINDKRMNYSVALGLFQCGAVESAARLATSIAEDQDNKLASQARLLQGRCMAALEQYEEADALFDSVDSPPNLKTAAQYRRARLDLHRGHFSSAEQSLRDLLKLEDPPRGATEALLQTLIHSGQLEGARALACEIGDTSLDLACLRHAADLLTEMGDVAPLQPLKRCWEASPSPPLFRELVTRHLALDEMAEAQQLIDHYAQTFGRDLHWQWGHAKRLFQSGDFDTLLAEKNTQQSDLLEIYCEACFAQGHYTEALQAAQQLCQSSPADQYFVALLVTALRCLDDPRYRVLIDPDRLVESISLFSGHQSELADPAFWSAVTDALASHHAMQRAPLLQSVEGGVQTPGNLLTQSQQPALNGLKSMIESSASSFFSSERLLDLPDAHPLVMSRPTTPRMHASWAIRAQSGTYHRSHVHSKGWYSGTCYVEVPACISDDTEAGHLVLGEPPFATKDHLDPIATIQPEQGKLVLFPSYVWHSTRPYSGEGWRQVIAFDFGKENRFV